MQFNPPPSPLPIWGLFLALLYLQEEDKAVRKGKNIYIQWSENKCHVSIKFSFKCSPEDASRSVGKGEKTATDELAWCLKWKFVALLTQHSKVLNILIILESKSKFPFIISAVRSTAQWNAAHLFVGPSLFIYLLEKLNLKIIPHIFLSPFLVVGSA